MTTPRQDVQAVHFADGNYFDNMLIDIAASHRRFATLPRNPAAAKASKWRNFLKLYLTRKALQLGLYELLVVNGIRRKWLDDFREYWSTILNGRPFTNTIDFFLLLHDYRKRQQHTLQLEWADPEQHLSNWQHPSQIYSTLHNVRKCATIPIQLPALYAKMEKGMRVLEFGCSLAPYYYCYREFFSHLECDWTLADIPNFPFHYARFLYRNDSNVDLITIDDSDFSDPLGEAADFDVIILTTVLEHLDNPSFTSEYLLGRLKPGGLFVFDYIKSEGKGLDHPNGLAMRQDCLESILGQTEVVYGHVKDITESVGLCIARKKPAATKPGI